MEKKKSYEDVSNYKIGSVKRVLQYIHNAKRGALVVFEENSGLIPHGTQNMTEVFEKYRVEFEIAARRDTLDLNDQDPEVRA